jgi:rhodanese-related sulfurtransferase
MPVPEIDVHELHARRQEGASLTDVRSPGEWSDVRVPGAALVPLGELVERVDDLPDAEPLHVICATGNRSARAVEYLRRLGIDAVNVAGGTRGWAEAGFPTDSGPG